MQNDEKTIKKQGGKRAGAGRKPGLKVKHKQMKIPLSLEPLITEIIKVSRGKGSPYSSYLILTLLDRAIGIPDGFLSCSRTMKQQGMTLIDRMLDGVQPQTELPDCPMSVLELVDQLKKDREIFRIQRGETLADDRDAMNKHMELLRLAAASVGS